MANFCYPPCCGDMPATKPVRVPYVGMPTVATTLCSQGVDEPARTNPIRRVRYRGVPSNSNKMSVGVLQSLVASNDKALYFDDAEMNGQRYAMCLQAFALVHILPVKKWTRKMLDSLMQGGAELYSAGPEDIQGNTLERVGDPEMTKSGPNKAYTSSEQGIRRVFKLEGYEFEVELDKKFLSKPKENELKRPSTDIPIAGLKSALQEFFKNREYCLLSTTNLYLFIWRSEDVYFVMDFYGRNAELDLLREGGFATLMCMREMRNVDYLVTQKSKLGKKDTFTLREMRLVMLVNPEGKALMSYFDPTRENDFFEVSDDYAYLKGDLHLSIKERDPLISRCGLPVSVAAIIASKIDHPASWDTRNMNKIICFGYYICQCCWQYCQNSENVVDYDSFPNQFRMGQFAVNLTILPLIEQGIWHCVPRYDRTELVNAIEKCFQNNYNYFLLTINQQTYSILKKNGFYYFFDPYRHRLPSSETRNSSLRMFASKEVFYQVLNLVLLESNTKSKFYIHRVVVTEIRASAGFECMPLEPKMTPEEDLVEAKSINEGICFRENFQHCYNTLGQISDDESEESVIEDLAGESEEEPHLGEEEGEFGDMEGVESGDEPGTKKRKRGRSLKRTGRGKIGRGGQGRGGRKRTGSSKGGSSTRRTNKGKIGKDRGGGKKGKRSRDSSVESPGGKGERRRRKSRSSGRRSRSSGRRSRSSGPRSRSSGPRSRSSGRKSRSSGRKSRSSGRKSRDASSRDPSARRSKSKTGDRKSRRLSRRESTKEKSPRRSKSRESKSRGRKSRESTSRGSKSRRSKSRASKDYKAEKGDGRKDDTDREKGKGDTDKDGSKKDDKRDSKKDEKGKTDDRQKDDKSKTDSEKTPGRDGFGKDSKKDGDAKVDGKGDIKKEDGGRKSDGGKSDIKKEGDSRKDEKEKFDTEDTAERYYKGTGEKRENYDKKSKDDSGLSTAFSQVQYGVDDKVRRSSQICQDSTEGDSDDQEGKICGPNSYPGYRCRPYNLGVAGSESGSYNSICKLLRTGFKFADRILTMTPFGNFVVFCSSNLEKKTYFVFDGCTCNVDRFRHLDITRGTAGLLSFKNMNGAIRYMQDSHSIRKSLRKNREQTVDDICSPYCK